MLNLISLLAIEATTKSFQYNYGTQAMTVHYLYETADAVPSSILVDKLLGTIKG